MPVNMSQQISPSAWVDTLGSMIHSPSKLLNLEFVLEEQPMIVCKQRGRLWPILQSYSMNIKT